MEAVMAKFKVLSGHLPGGIEENHEKPVRIISVLAEIQTVPSSKCKSEYCI
jgi:hypothetical protein